MTDRPFDALARVEPFSRLDAAARAEIAGEFQLLDVPRGRLLIEEGETSQTLYVVVTGRFSVATRSSRQKVAEITAGQMIGEISFFAGGVRTASVRAERDSLVLALSKSGFEALASRMPELWPEVARTLAGRLAETTAGRCPNRTVQPKTIAVCRAGNGQLSTYLVETLRERCADDPGRLFLGPRSVAGYPQLVDDDSQVRTANFNDLEKQYDQIVFRCEDEPTEWTAKALRQADQVLLVAEVDRSMPSDAIRLNAVEQLVAELHEPRNVRLVLVHQRHQHIVEGTGRWLGPRPFVGMHHHVAQGRSEDFDRLMRFLDGTALGLVASGGGAFTASHIGMYQALTEAGHTFDMFCGTSGGAAMTAAFASGVDPDVVDRHTHEMFVTRKAMGRWTWPRYSLLDHRVFDDTLEEFFDAGDIADLWCPYFAVATNLSRNRLEILRRGPLWKAIRASAAIPALFPPVFQNGEMLVDGCLLDNVPLAPMRSMKNGPNVILELSVPGIGRCEIDTAKLPSRAELLRGFLKQPSQEATGVPGPQAVLLRSLLRENRDIASELGTGDILLSFPVPEGANVLDWSNHRELRWAAYAYARDVLGTR